VDVKIQKQPAIKDKQHLSIVYQEAVKGYQLQRKSIIEQMCSMSATGTTFSKKLKVLREELNKIDKKVFDILFQLGE